MVRQNLGSFSTFVNLLVNNIIIVVIRSYILLNKSITSDAELYSFKISIASRDWGSWWCESNLFNISFWLPLLIIEFLS